MLKLVRYGVVACAVILLLGSLLHSGCSRVAERPPAVGLPAPGPDFAARCTAPGVLRCFGFDSSADFPDADPGAGHNRCWGCNYGIGPNGNVATIPTLDTSVKASGAGSMLFTINSNTGSGGAGNWFTNFTPDLQGFGQGQTFFIQWRQRFDPNYVNYDFRGSAGKKLVIIGAVDKPTCSTKNANTVDCPASCTDIEVVPTAEDAGSRNDIVTVYNSCVRFAGFEYNDGHQVTKQNAIPNCYYPNFFVPPCVRIWPNEWMTFKVQISIGTWNQRNSTFRMWVGREGQPLVKIIDFSPQSGRPWTAFRNDASHLYGKVWLLPYATGKDSTETHPTAFTWYDDLIISTQDIADPGGTIPQSLPYRADNVIK